MGAREKTAGLGRFRDSKREGFFRRILAQTLSPSEGEGEEGKCFPCRHWLLAKISGYVVVLLMLEVVAGCRSTPKSVAKMEGQGCKQVFHAPYESAWAASRGAAGRYTRVLQADRQCGFILGKLGINDSTFGENVAIWVHPLSSSQTSIEVVSRHAGPPVLPGQGLEKPIMDNIAVMLDAGEVFR